MRWLLRLYPRDWRRRYGAEMEALLAEVRPGPREVVDLVRGAVDARLHPQWPLRRRRILPALAALVVLLSPFVSQAVVAPPTNGSWRMQIEPAIERAFVLFRIDGLPVDAALLLALFWAVAAVVGLAVRSAGLTRFCALVAFRFLADGVLALVLALWVFVPVLGWFGPRGLNALDLLVVVLWIALDALILLRTDIPWPIALAVGCVLELVTGGTALSLPATLGAVLPVTLLEPLRITVWAAVLAALAARRRPRRGWHGGPGEAGVRARPRPGAPPALAARARLDDDRGDRIASRG